MESLGMSLLRIDRGGNCDFACLQFFFRKYDVF